MTVQAMPQGQQVYFNSQLPWSSSTQENSRFLKICIGILVLTLLLALFVGLKDLP
jgi:hypothetical protein